MKIDPFKKKRTLIKIYYLSNDKYFKLLFLNLNPYNFGIMSNTQTNNFDFVLAIIFETLLHLSWIRGVKKKYDYLRELPRGVRQ